MVYICFRSATGSSPIHQRNVSKYWLGIKGTDGKPDKGVALLLEPTPTFYEQKRENLARSVISSLCIIF